jgi:Mg-chelatase subunit ChlD
LAAADLLWLTFGRPWWLLALAATLVPVAAALLGRRRGRLVALPAIVGQCLAVALVAFALAEPMAPLGAEARLPYLLFVDASGSVRGQGEVVNRLHFPPHADVERFNFAGGLARAIPPSDLGATDIAPVLRLISARASSSAGAVIVTDGQFTDRDWPAQALAAGRSGAQVVIVPMNVPPRDSGIADFQARRRQADVELAVTVVANAEARPTLTVTRAGRFEPVLAQKLTLLPGWPETIRASDALALGQEGRYAARLETGDLIGENDSAEALVLPLTAKFAAFGDEGVLTALLAKGGVAVTYQPLDKCPADAAGLAGFSAVIVSDPAGAGLAPAQRKALADYARAGGGVVMLGVGPHEKSADGDDPLNRALPLVPNPFERKPLDLRVVLDKSGSMGQVIEPAAGQSARRKFDIASEAVAALEDQLTPRDALTVIAFSDAPELAYDSGDGPPDFAALREALRKVRPSGSTKVTPALKLALDGPVRGKRSPMLLVVSDLDTEDFKPAAWVKRLADQQARLAVVAVGTSSEANPPLELLAKNAGAALVHAESFRGLAGVFSALVRAGRGPVVRQEKQDVAIEGPLFDSGVKALPSVETFLLTAKRPDATVLARTASGEPVIASVPAGMGRSAQVALPLGPGVNADWPGNADAAAVVSSAARWAMRPGNDPRLDVRLDRAGEELSVSVSARQDGAPVNKLELSAVAAAGGKTVTVALPQVAGGEYRGAALGLPDAPAAVAVKDGQGMTLWQGAAPMLCSKEFRAIGVNDENLQKLADATGGRVASVDQAGGVLAESFRRQNTPLTGWLLAAALLVMLVEWPLARIRRK